MESVKRTDSNEPKLAVSHHESHADDEPHTHNKHHHHQDAALKVLGDGSGRVHMTDEQSEIVRRKIDRRILPILMWIYFLQILDKSCIGYGATFGLQTEAHLHGNQYSLIGSAGYWAQLGVQPFTALLIVKVPTKWLVTVLVFCWGAMMCGLAASTNFTALIACRFFLGLFEAAVLPMFAVITMTWYRRREQPMRVALWYGTNGLASMFGSFIAWALSFIKSDVLYVYQILFLLTGLLTVLTAPFIILFLDNNPAEAKFLTAEEKTWAVERLRDNNTGIESKEFKWNQLLEAMLSPQLWLFVGLSFCLNYGASVTNVFGPLIIKSFGFDSRKTILLNIPFGFMQMCCILGLAFVATKLSRKSISLGILVVPCIIGASLLYAIVRNKANTGPLLFGYYLIAFLFAGNPLTVSWIASNTAGYTKKSVSMAMYQIGASVGNIVGPIVFNSKDAPLYHTGLSSVLGVFVASGAITIALVALFGLLNKLKEKERVRNGKPAKLVDRSMNAKYVSGDVDENGEMGAGGAHLGDQAFADLTDRQNDEFIYTY
jgi:MFS family permease